MFYLFVPMRLLYEVLYSSYRYVVTFKLDMSLSGREWQLSVVFAKSNRKIIILTALIGVILFAFLHKSDLSEYYQVKLNNVEETACNLGT